ncbi:MAG: divalent-cation tolerance protein CutA [Elusimicrobia bacterium]|nr:divalent-cation tolerance protein CutA [Elusimicrobiota bacterium]
MTTPTAREARRLADVLVTEGLAACVHIQGLGRSVYRWKGRIERAAEHSLLAKTTRAGLPALVRRVQSLHSYSVPEIVALPIQGGNPAYLAWLAESVA